LGISNKGLKYLRFEDDSLVWIIVASGVEVDGKLVVKGIDAIAQIVCVQQVAIEWVWHGWFPCCAEVANGGDQRKYRSGGGKCQAKLLDTM